MIFEKEELKMLYNKYNIDVSNIGEVINSSHGEDDIRLNYIIDDLYVLKINNSNVICEEFITNISKLVERYRNIGVYCPKLYKNKDDMYTYSFIKNNHHFTCYVEEFAKYKILEEKENIDYEFKEKMLPHLGKFASKYTNVDLIETKSMWSIIDLSPFDEGIDEKQENLNTLVSCLNSNNYGLLAQKLIHLNINARLKILQHFNKLPRCVYQGDLNSSNILVDEKYKFKGIIDFNMFGTEVNINCFLNESMYFIRENDFDTLSAEEILIKMKDIQNKLLASICSNYSLNELEIDSLCEYNRVIFSSFYPNVMLWIKLINEYKNKEKVIEVLEMICLL